MLLIIHLSGNIVRSIPFISLLYLMVFALEHLVETILLPMEGRQDLSSFEGLLLQPGQAFSLADKFRGVFFFFVIFVKKIVHSKSKGTTGIQDNF